jgi:hypothetical protein
VLEKSTKSKSIYISILDNQDFIERFFNTLAKGYKMNNIASCNYPENINMPEQGEN